MRRILPFCLAFLTTLTSIASAVPLSGTYTIGSGGTYGTVAAAVSDLLSRGVSGPVTFQVKTGTYAQQLAINGVIAGASAVNRVRFVAQSGNAADVVLQSPAV